MPARHGDTVHTLSCASRHLLPARVNVNRCVKNTVPHMTTKVSQPLARGLEHGTSRSSNQFKDRGRCMWRGVWVSLAHGEGWLLRHPSCASCPPPFHCPSELNGTVRWRRRIHSASPTRRSRCLSRSVNIETTLRKTVRGASFERIFELKALSSPKAGA